MCFPHTVMPQDSLVGFSRTVKAIEVMLGDNDILKVRLLTDSVSVRGTLSNSRYHIGAQCMNTSSGQEGPCVFQSLDSG